MSVIEELIRLEDDGTLSFGNYLVDSKKKVSDFEVDGDLYYVKTYNEITKVEKNSKLLLEVVPGATIHNLKMNDKNVTFSAESNVDVHVTMELEAEKEYKIFVDDFIVGSVKATLAGKINFSLDTKSGAKEVKIEKVN
ncbi:MAG: endosialidase [Lachnospiraceae bacterium]|nr:endosialidase [Lachnospiraceae bacterium]